VIFIQGYSSEGKIRFLNRAMVQGQRYDIKARL
jgi:hypothetical protein